MSFLSKLFGSNNNNDNLQALVGSDVFLVDVRSPMEFSSGSVKNAVNIPLDTINMKLAKFKSKKNIIVFCRSGNRSAQAKTILEQNGITNVVNGGTWNNVNALFNA